MPVIVYTAQNNAMSDSYQFGKEAEEIAKAYLVQEGYKILAQNYFVQKAEIDLIAQKGDLVIVVEVKARKHDTLTEPEAAITSKKMKLLVKAADHYMQQSNLNLEVQFDILALLKTGTNWSIKHLKNAFDASEI